RSRRRSERRAPSSGREEGRRLGPDRRWGAALPAPSRERARCRESPRHAPRSRSWWPASTSVRSGRRPTREVSPSWLLEETPLGWTRRGPGPAPPGYADPVFGEPEVRLERGRSRRTEQVTSCRNGVKKLWRCRSPFRQTFATGKVSRPDFDE